MPAPDGRSADQARAAIQEALGQIGFTLPGTITIRRTRCGKPRCACTADPPSLHGPYIQWTRKGRPLHHQDPHRRRSRTAPPYFAAHRRLRQLITELEAISIELAKQPATPKRLYNSPIKPRPVPTGEPARNGQKLGDQPA